MVECLTLGALRMVPSSCLGDQVPTDYIRGDIIRVKNKEDLKKSASKIPESDCKVLSKVQRNSRTTTEQST